MRYDFHLVSQSKAAMRAGRDIRAQCTCSDEDTGSSPDETLSQGVQREACKLTTRTTAWSWSSCLCQTATGRGRQVTAYCETIRICWTYNFVFFVGKTIHEFMIRTKYLFTLVILQIIWNSWIQVSTNMSNGINPRIFVPKILNSFTVYIKLVANIHVRAVNKVVSKLSLGTCRLPYTGTANRLHYTSPENMSQLFWPLTNIIHNLKTSTCINLASIKMTSDKKKYCFFPPTLQNVWLYVHELASVFHQLFPL